MHHKPQKTFHLPLNHETLRKRRDTMFVSCGVFKSVHLEALSAVRREGSSEASCWVRNALILQLTRKRIWWLKFLWEVLQSQVSKLILLLFLLLLLFLMPTESLQDITKKEGGKGKLFPYYLLCWNWPRLSTLSQSYLKKKNRTKETPVNQHLLKNLHVLNTLRKNILVE